jgi:hypothetical protein
LRNLDKNGQTLVQKILFLMKFDRKPQKFNKNYQKSTANIQIFSLSTIKKEKLNFRLKFSQV